MAQREHKDPRQKEPRSFGETLHESRIVELGAAPAVGVTELLSGGPPRGKALIEARPLESPEELETPAGFSRAMDCALRSGGAPPGKRARLKTRQSAA